MIAFSCPKCGKRAEADRRLAGEVVTCPRCHATLRVPNLADPIEPITVQPMPEPPREAPVAVLPEQRSAFSSGFNATCGVIAAIFVVFVLFPCAGFILLGILLGGLGLLTK